MSVIQIDNQDDFIMLQGKIQENGKVQVLFDMSEFISVKESLDKIYKDRRYQRIYAANGRGTGNKSRHMRIKKAILLDDKVFA